MSTKMRFFYLITNNNEISNTKRIHNSQGNRFLDICFIFTRLWMTDLPAVFYLIYFLCLLCFFSPVGVRLTLMLSQKNVYLFSYLQSCLISIYVNIPELTVNM